MFLSEFVCYCGDISTSLNMNIKNKCDWLLFLSVIWPLGRALTNESYQDSRPLAISLKVWLRKTNQRVALLYGKRTPGWLPGCCYAVVNVF